MMSKLTPGGTRPRSDSQRRQDPKEIRNEAKLGDDEVGEGAGEFAAVDSRDSDENG